jgi:organic radical activating enzyme
MVERLGMNDKLPEMPFLKNIGLLMTYRCQVTCPHCIIEAGPHRHEEMDLEDALAWIRQAAQYRAGYIKVLSLTGGEPFYDITKLRQISSYGNRSGFLVSAVTNAYWASSPGEAITTLRSLPAVQMLSISTDAYHQVAIPIERVRNAAEAARVLGVPFTVAVCTENEDDPAYRAIVDELAAFVDKDLILTAVTFRAGRALKRGAGLRYAMSDDPPVSACSAGGSPIVFPDGRVMACIGPVIGLEEPHPLLLGNLREDCLRRILDSAELNPILHIIRLWGPRRLISMIREAGLGHLLPRSYVKDSVCNACYSLMSSPAIVEYLWELSEDPRLKEKVAYARAYYLKELRMIELLGLLPTGEAAVASVPVSGGDQVPA